MSVVRTMSATALFAYIMPFGCTIHAAQDRCHAVAENQGLPDPRSRDSRTSPPGGVSRPTLSPAHYCGRHNIGSGNTWARERAAIARTRIHRPTRVDSLYYIRPISSPPVRESPIDEIGYTSRARHVIALDVSDKREARRPGSAVGPGRQSLRAFDCSRRQPEFSAGSECAPRLPRGIAGKVPHPEGGNSAQLGPSPQSSDRWFARSAKIPTSGRRSRSRSKHS